MRECALTVAILLLQISRTALVDLAVLPEARNLASWLHCHCDQLLYIIVAKVYWYECHVAESGCLSNVSFGSMSTNPPSAYKLVYVTEM